MNLKGFSAARPGERGADTGTGYCSGEEDPRGERLLREERRFPPFTFPLSRRRGADLPCFGGEDGVDLGCLIGDDLTDRAEVGSRLGCGSDSSFSFCFPFFFSTDLGTGTGEGGWVWLF